MTGDIELETSLDIMSIASKYIVSSVVVIAFGAISIVYSLLAYLVYGDTMLPILIFGVFFTGAAFMIIGVFLTFWGLLLMRSEGKRLRERYRPRSKEPEAHSEDEPVKKKRQTKPTKPKGPTWEEVSDRAYGRIEWYATRFLIISTLGVVIGVIGIVYAFFSMVFFASSLQDVNVFLGAFIGIGALVASLIMLGWGFFWRRQSEVRTLF